MKAVIIQVFGGPEGLAVVDHPDPKPSKDQVLIATEAIGLGFQDVMIRRGDLSAYGFKSGHIPGGEIAGTVITVGDDADRHWIGRRVWAFTGLGGGYAERAVAPVASLVPLPTGLSPAAAVTIGSAGVVAHFGLKHARFAPGESVLVRGAAGPIGILSVQLAAHSGASVEAVTTSSADRGGRLLELGATRVLDRAGLGGAEAPAGYDVIIDVVAGVEMSSFLARLNAGGRLVAVGAVGGMPPADFAGGMFASFQKSLTFSTFSAMSVPDTERRAWIANLFDMAAGGDLKVITHDIVALGEAANAHRRLEAGEPFGRIVLAPMHERVINDRR